MWRSTRSARPRCAHLSRHSSTCSTRLPRSTGAQAGAAVPSLPAAAELRERHQQVGVVLAAAPERVHLSRQSARCRASRLCSALERPTAHAHLPNRRNARSVRGAPSNDTRTDGRTGAPIGAARGRKARDRQCSAVQPEGTRAYGGEWRLLTVRERQRGEGQRKAAHRHAVRRRRHPRGDVLHDRIRVRLAVRRVAVGEEQNRGARRPAARSTLEDPTRITGAP